MKLHHSASFEGNHQIPSRIIRITIKQNLKIVRKIVIMKAYYVNVVVTKD